MTEVKIAEVEYEKGYWMSVRLNNGNTIRFCMEPKIVTARFRDLADWEVFHRGEISKCGRLITWNDNTEISIEEILLYVRSA